MGYSLSSYRENSMIHLEASRQCTNVCLFFCGFPSSSFFFFPHYSRIRDSIFSQTQTQTQSLPTLPTHWPQDLISSLLSILLTNIIDLDLYISLLSLHKTYCINKRRHHQKKRNSSQK